MILPSKHLSQDRALLTVGANILKRLGQPKTVSALWEEVSKQDSARADEKPFTISYDWFVLALDLLYLMDAIELHAGRIARRPV